MLESLSIPPDWLPIFETEFHKPYFIALDQFLTHESKLEKTILPPSELILNAFKITPFNDLKVVIIGQDPYHGYAQANGLSFSVNEGVRIPPSLKNIYKELANDIPGFNIPKHGNLTAWAKQGVLLLNATLTVELNKPGSHQKQGWELFTNHVIEQITTHKKNLVFMLWGNFAMSKANLINGSEHLILKAAHPSPFSAHKGFLGCKHFSQANKFLETVGLNPIQWQL